MSVTKKIREAGKAQTSGRKFQRFSGEATKADWSTVDMTQLWETISKVTAGGGAIRFGYTADGGAYAIGVYGDGAQPYTEYVRPQENIERVLAELGAAFDGPDRPEDVVGRTATKKVSPTASEGR